MFSFEGINGSKRAWIPMLVELVFGQCGVMKDGSRIFNRIPKRTCSEGEELLVGGMSAGLAQQEPPPSS